jgi:D-apionolactonase
MGWLDEEVAWASGAWSLVRRDDELADIAHDGRVVLRSIRLVVRDHDWETATLVVDAVDADERMLRLDVHSEGLGSSFSGTLAVRVADGALTVEAELVSAADFDTNRTGLVLLHPPSLAGRALEVTHPDGASEATRFPTAISPHQPAMQITALEWKSEAGAVRVAFSGDVFEMEDQRNWTDASYKTYSRPLALPFPYRVAAGEHVRQAVRVSVTGAPHAATPAARDLITLHPAGRMPAMAVAASTAADPAPALVAPPAAAATLVELDLASPTWRAALERAAGAGRALDVRFVLDEDAAQGLDDGVRALRGLPVSRVTAFRARGAARHVSDVAAVTALRDALARGGVDAPVAGGARTHFTELNREHHRLPADLDGIGFAVTPLFHSRSTAQLVESLAMQRLVAEQAARIAGDVPVDIGPISLRPHVNGVSTAPAPVAAHPDLRTGYGPHLLDADDPRIDAPELAAWTIASAAALAVPGVRSLTYFEEWGPRGLFDSDGAERPVAAAVRALAELAGSPALVGDSPDALVWALGALTPAGAVALVANLDRGPRTVRVRAGRAAASVPLPPSTWGRVLFAEGSDELVDR